MKFLYPVVQRERRKVFSGETYDLLKSIKLAVGADNAACDVALPPFVDCRRGPPPAVAVHVNRDHRFSQSSTAILLRSAKSTYILGPEDSKAVA
jgi:hypothetical protein